MTIPLTGSGSLSARQGVLFGGIADVLALAGGTATTRVLSGANMGSRVVSTIDPAFAAGTALPQIVDGSLTQLSSFQSGLAGIVGQFAGYAKNCLLSMYSIDQQGQNSNAPLQQLITGFTAQQAISTLISQMNGASATVQGATVSAGSQTAVGSPSGNPTILLSLKNRQGLVMQLVFPETLTFTCAQDSQTGGLAVGNEIVAIAGQAAVGNSLSYLWPGGSGAARSIAAVSGATNNSANNLMMNGLFTAYSNPNLPDQFAAGAGSVGTAILNGSGTTYLSGGGSVEFVGDGSTLIGITQAFGTTPSTSAGAGGTLAALTPDTVYHGCIFYKLSASSPAAGVLEVALIDGSSYPGTVIADDQSTNNTATATLTSVADTLWHPLTFAFRTPAVLPTTTPVARLRIRLSTALSSGKNLFLSNLTLTPATQLYAGGPNCSIHCGSNRMIAGLNPDRWTIATSNGYSTSGGGLFQQFYERVFGMRAMGLQLPYAASSPTIADSVIT